MNTSKQPECETRIQKCLLDNPDLSIEFIKEVLDSKNHYDSSAEMLTFKNKDE